MNAFFIVGMFVITAGYSSTLVSFYSVDVYPSVPESFEDIAEYVVERDLLAHICCVHIKHAMKGSSLPSFQTLTDPKRVCTTEY